MERHVIIGTAGHIDHGKTTLIKTLTGRDTDRLKEEKARGITIDLGFTWMDLTDGERVGIIDVPGHEKFISNMTAGVVGMDLVLLVIAADEGIMPQTREHLAILRLLGVENILVVLNKCDLVDEEWLEMVEQQICEEMQQMFTVGQRNDQAEETLSHRMPTTFLPLSSRSLGHLIPTSLPQTVSIPSAAARAITSVSMEARSGGNSGRSSSVM